MNFEFNPSEVGRIRVCLAERKKKLEKGIAKFGEDFDPVLGQNMTNALADYKRLLRKLEK